jgi:hypothetical protein
MPFSRLQYDERDLAVMQASFDAACAELGVGADDKAQRERLAEMICEIAKTYRGLDVSSLSRQAIATYRQRSSR